MSSFYQLIEGVHFIPAVVCYPRKDNKILLGLRKNTDLGPGVMSGIGGKVGDDPIFAHETFDEAIVREYREECDITLTDFFDIGRVKFVYPNKPSWNMDVAIYIARDWKGEPKASFKTDPVWVDANNIPFDQMWQDNRYWIPKALSGERVDAVFVYSNDHKVLDYVLR